MTPAWLSTLGFAMGSAWLSGINLYATVVTLGILQRLGLATLPGDLKVLENWWIIGVAGFLYAMEFIANKIPAVDSVWDAIHTFIRIPAGAVLAASAFGSFDPSVRMMALLLGGGVALASHGTKSAVRLAANTSPEPFSNIGLGVLEDLTSAGGSALMVFHPVVILVLVVICLVMAIYLFRKIANAIRSRFRRGSAVPGAGVPRVLNPVDHV
ncbi:MAG TPA: DUF4126 domain-containing protein [Bryobacteraceae bacterium]|nr:DUF4126 domain-containing protein [Bryobacteraceae bacterium]